MIEIGGGYHLLTRGEWGATLTGGYKRKNSISEVWIHHSVTVADNSQWIVNDVISDMKEIERIGKQRFNRFPYSFCFHPSGIIAEGGGWDVVGAHTANHNSRGVGFCAIGNYEADPIPETIVFGIINLTIYGIKTGKLVGSSFPTGGHRDLKATACPGSHLYGKLPFIKQKVAEGLPIELTNPQAPRRIKVEANLPQLSKTVRGSQPHHTMSLQSMLRIKASQTIIVDGDFGPATEGAVKNLQKITGLSVDGIVGPKTWKMILEIPF